MSLDDLREHGVLLPEEEWGAHRLATTVAQGRLGAAFGVAGVAAAVMYLGNGGRWTWLGLLTFLFALCWIVWLCDRAIVRQRERTAEERREG